MIISFQGQGHFIIFFVIFGAVKTRPSRINVIHGFKKNQGLGLYELRWSVLSPNQTGVSTYLQLPAQKSTALTLQQRN